MVEELWRAELPDGAETFTDAALDLDADEGGCPACGGVVPRGTARCPGCGLRFA